MPYLLDSDPSSSELSEAVNYLLCNFDTSVSSDANTGEVKGPTGQLIGYLYKYLAVKYADSFDGSVNFSNSPTGRAYFGVRNSDAAAESSNYTDYVWNKVTGGFGTTKFLWYITTGGRQIQFAVATTAPSTGWLVDPGASIDLDVVTSGTSTTIAQAFVSYFSPNVLQVPRTGSVLTPVFTGIRPALYATNAGVIVPFTDAQTDAAAGFVNNSWRIGASSTTGNADISYTNITIGAPTDAGDYALWPVPTAMPSSPAYISVPIRFKNSTGIITQASVSSIQLVYADPGATGPAGNKSITVSAFRWSNSGATVPTQAFTYTWSGGTISAFPAGWTSAATASPGSGYTLYTVNLVISDVGSATTTTTNWSGGSIGSIGYTQDGSIGPQGDGARIAYCKSTIASPSGTTTSTGTSSLPATGSFGLTGSVFYTSPPSLVTGEYLYQTDGIYVVGTNIITWATPYLSNLKVGSLSAISANLGVVNIATAGNLNSGKTSYSSTTAGFFLGNDSGTPRLSIGTATSYFNFDGTNVNVGGNIDTTGTAKFNGATTIGGFTYALSANRPTSSTYGTSLRGIIGAAQGDAAGQAVGIEGQVADTTLNPGYAGVWGRATGTSPTAYGVRGDAAAGIAGSFYSITGKALELTTGAGQPPMTVNSSIVVTNLNSEFWGGAKSVGIALNGTSGTLPTAYPPVTLTYNVVRYIQVNIGGITGYIPVYI